MSVRFISHSGATAGEANAHALSSQEGTILFDCGAGGGSADYLEELERPDAIWISHAHGDHCGALLDVVARWPRVPVLATATTRRLLEFALTTGSSTKARAAAVARRVEPVAMQRFMAVPGLDDARIMALPAGHVPGAAMAVVEYGREDDGVVRVLYTGDFCTHDQAVVEGAGIPRRDGGFAFDAVVSEAMLATDETADRVVWSDEADAVVEAVDEAEGPVLVGVTAIGESVEVAALLEESGVSMVVDDYLTPVFEACTGGPSVDSPHLTFGGRRRLAQALDGGGIVIASGDQLRASTTAGKLVDRIVGDETATVVVLNRARRHTPAGALVGGRRGADITWRGGRRTLEARVVHRRLINHAPRWQLMGFIEGVGAETTLLVHGSDGARWSLKRALAKQGYDGEVEVADDGQPIIVRTTEGPEGTE